MTDFPAIVQFDCEKDPVFGDLHAPLSIFGIEENNDTAQWREHVSECVEDFLARANPSSSLMNGSIAAKPDALHKEAHALLYQAIVLGLPDDVEKLGRACPQVVAVMIDRNEPDNELLNVYRAPLTPYGLALRLSRLQVMQALARVILTEGHRVESGLRFTIGMDGPNFEHRDNKHYDLLKAENRLQAQFLPSAFALALSHQMAQPERGAHPRVALRGMAINALERGHWKNQQTWIDDPVFERYIPAFIAAGLYDEYPSYSLARACVNSRIDVLNHLKDIRDPALWDDVLRASLNPLTSPVAVSLKRACDLSVDLDVPDCEKFLLALAEMAVQNGQQALVFKRYEGPEGQIEPMDSILRLQMNGLLVPFMENGWDPKQAMAPGADSMMALAEKIGNEEAKAIMHSFMARKLSRSLIDEIEAITPSATSGVRP